MRLNNVLRGSEHNMMWLYNTISLYCIVLRLFAFAASQRQKRRKRKKGKGRGRARGGFVVRVEAALYFTKGEMLKRAILALPDRFRSSIKGRYPNIRLVSPRKWLRLPYLPRPIYNFNWAVWGRRAACPHKTGHVLNPLLPKKETSQATCRGRPLRILLEGKECV